MSITFSYRLVALLAVAAAAVSGQVQAAHPGSGAAGRPAAVAARASGTGAAAQAATFRYWTTTRMAAALGANKAPASPRRTLVKRVIKREVTRQPLTGNTAGHGLPWAREGAATNAVGKVFFTLDGKDYVCSGTLVTGGVVLTAAHCVTGGRTANGAVDWATNWMFAPGYHDGRLPHGEYTARRFFVTKGWTGPAGGAERYDVAFVQIDTGTLHGGSARGGTPNPLPVAFARSQDAAPASRAYVLGYPSLAPYSGQDPDYCAGPVAPANGSVRMACAMTAGDSGGPWLAGFSPRSGAGPVVAVSTYKFSDDLSVLYGAVLGPQAHALYARAVSSAG